MHFGVSVWLIRCAEIADGRGATPLLAKAVTDALSDDDVSSSDSKGSNTMHLDSYSVAHK